LPGDGSLRGFRGKTRVEDERIGKLDRLAHGSRVAQCYRSASSALSSDKPSDFAATSFWLKLVFSEFQTAAFPYRRFQFEFLISNFEFSPTIAG
jgi:hypothetical protein